MSLSFRDELRKATAAEHQRLDRTVTKLRLTDRSDYIAFLTMHASILLPLEHWLEQNGVAEDLPDWHIRKRSAAIQKDLASLGVKELAPASLCFEASLPTRAGILYVLEGSRLGGRLLASQVGQAVPSLPRSFLLQGRGQGLWQSFVAWVNGLAIDNAVTTMAANSARALFQAYQAQADHAVRVLK